MVSRDNTKQAVPTSPIVKTEETQPYYPYYKTCLWFVYFAVFCGLNAMLAKYAFLQADKRGLNTIHPPLPDLLHDIDSPLLKFFSDQVLWLPDSLFALNVICCLIMIQLRPQRNRIMSYYLKIWGTMFVLRATVMPTTILPSPILPCRDSSLTHIPGLRDTRNSFVPNGLMYCNDLLFSGHATINILCYLFWHFSDSHVLLKGIVFLYSLFAVSASVLTRDHYTVDVLLAVYICVLLTLHFKDQIKASMRAKAEYTDCFWRSFFPPSASDVARLQEQRDAAAVLEALPVPNIQPQPQHQHQHQQQHSEVITTISSITSTAAADVTPAKPSLATSVLDASVSALSELSPVRTPSARPPHDTSSTPCLLSPSVAPSSRPASSSSLGASPLTVTAPGSALPAPTAAAVQHTSVSTYASLFRSRRSTSRAPTASTAVATAVPKYNSLSSSTSSSASSAPAAAAVAAPAPAAAAVAAGSILVVSKSTPPSPSPSPAPTSAPASAASVAAPPAPRDVHVAAMRKSGVFVSSLFDALPDADAAAPAVEEEENGSEAEPEPVKPKTKAATKPKKLTKAAAAKAAKAAAVAMTDDEDPGQDTPTAPMSQSDEEEGEEELAEEQPTKRRRATRAVAARTSKAATATGTRRTRRLAPHVDEDNDGGNVGTASETETGVSLSPVPATRTRARRSSRR